MGESFLVDDVPSTVGTTDVRVLIKLTIKGKKKKKKQLVSPLHTHSDNFGIVDNTTLL